MQQGMQPRNRPFAIHLILPASIIIFYRKQKIMWSRPTSGMVMSWEWKKKEGSTFIFRMIWEVRCGLQMKQEEVRKPMDLMNLVMISERQKISSKIHYRALVLRGIRWIVQEGCILHRQEDMMPELEDLSVKIS